MTSEEKTEEHPFVDIFDEDEAERAYLLSKPTCFVVFGKPGTGKTTLAGHIAQAWKCVHVEAISVLEERIATEMESEATLQSLLVSGHSIPDELVTKLLVEKLNSSEVSHFGYIFTELPSVTSNAITTMQQLELIKNLNLKPDIIINIKCADYDVCQRVSGQRQHSTTGYVYTRDQWDPEIIESRRKKKKDSPKEGKVDEEEEEEEEEEQEEEETLTAEMQAVTETLQHLVQRPEDFLENVENSIKLYKETVLHALEEMMAEHNPQYLIELDGNKPPEELFMTVIDRMKHLNLRRAAVLTRLQSAEEEISNITDNEDLFRTLSSYKLIAPRYRWHRSRWGQVCPVSLKEGTISAGSADFSVSFLGKMYCLSSEAMLKTFLLNPRSYLLPPMPMPSCKVFIFGPTYSGKTTLSNLIAEYFRGQAIDYAKVIQPLFDKAREELINDTITEATNTAIKTVRDQLHAELQAKKLAEKISAMESESKKEVEEFPNYMLTNSDVPRSSFNEEAGSAQDSKRDSTLVVTEEGKSKSANTLDKDDRKESSDLSTLTRSSQDLSQGSVVESDKVSTEDSLEEVTASHPMVVAMLQQTLKQAKDKNFEQPYDKHAEILEKVLKEVMEENRNRYTGAPKNGGWIVDNCPLIKDLWMAFMDREIPVDLVICLSDTESNEKCLLNRAYLNNKSVIDAQILERLLGELQTKKKEIATTRNGKEEKGKQEEKQKVLVFKEKAKEVEDADKEAEEKLENEHYENQEEEEGLEVPEEKRESLLPDDFKAPDAPEAEAELESVSEPPEATTVEIGILRGSKEDLESEELSEAVVLPEFPEDSYPDVPEMEPFKENINDFLVKWKPLEQLVIENFIQILTVEIANKTPNELLQKIVETMEKPFQYNARELTVEDYDEETEDEQAEVETEEEQEEDGDEESEDEERLKEKKRHLGDTKHFCPVVLKENFILQPGNTEEAVKYREKIYYFSNAEAKDKFLEHPGNYVAHGEPLKAPPLRICLLGPHGSGKTLCARHLAENFGLFHIQFDEVLQEKLLLKAERRFFPENEEESEEEQAIKKEMEELAMQANIKIEEESTKKKLPEVELTEEEEAIKSSLMENEPLPWEILDLILSEWWLKEPFRSTGFILDGFPRYPEESQFLGERGFFPDAAVFIQVNDEAVFDRLLPAKIEQWKEKQNKKLERRNIIKDIKTKIREDMIAKRRAELISERPIKQKEESNGDNGNSEEEAEEDDDIENILEEEFPKDEEEMSEEDEEQETNATQRLRNELREKYEADVNNIQMIQDEFDKVLIPIIAVEGARKIHIVQYVLNMKLKPLVENRASIFEKCYPIPAKLAQKMLTYTYKYISSFGYWDPVKLSEGETLKPVENAENPTYPVIHRQYIYFLSSKETREKFMMNPIKYIRQPKPKPAMPIRIFILGPPKSGKTTVAKKLASDYGFRRWSIGECLRVVLNNYPETELARTLNWHLYKGMTVPDELALQALDISLMDSMCNTVGVIIDGYPVTSHQMNLLEARSIIPMIIFELDVPSKEIFKRLLLEKKNQKRFPYPLHNSSEIIAVKNAKYRKNITEIRQFYQEQHQNWHVIDGFHSKWWVWNEVTKNIQKINKHMQIYMERIQEGKAACIDKLCITPDELISRLGEFGQYCPVSLAETYELIDCSVSDSLEFAAEFRGHYYKMNSLENLNKFLEHPELYVPPLAPYPLPSADMIPKRLTLTELKSSFPKCAEFQGYCSVTYQDGKHRYEALVPGDIEYAAEYRDRIYIFETEEKLQKFLRSPLRYCDQQLPKKLPPPKEPICLTSLPLPGYLEQGVSTSLIKAMNSAGCLKPKFPFLSIRRSALLYIAFHLKAFNPKGSAYSRQKYKKKMEQFIERCELITYLGAKMTRKYKAPQFRAIDFDHKLQTFLSLRNIDPVNG